MSLPDYLLLALVAVALWAAFRAIRQGKSRCGGGCGACPWASQCTKQKKN